VKPAGLTNGELAQSHARNALASGAGLIRIGLLAVIFFILPDKKEELITQ
jgi:hypothetical protein